MLEAVDRPAWDSAFKTTVFNYKIQISASGLMNVWKCAERRRQRAAGRSCLSRGAIQPVFVVSCRNTAVCQVSRGGPRAVARQAGGECPAGLFPHAGFLFFLFCTPIKTRGELIFRADRILLCFLTCFIPISSVYSEFHGGIFKRHVWP